MVTREKAHAQLLVVSKHCGRPTSLLSDSARWSTFSLSLSIPTRLDWISNHTRTEWLYWAAAWVILHSRYMPNHVSMASTRHTAKKKQKKTSFLCFPTAYLRYTQTHTVFVGAVISRSKHNCIQAVHCPLWAMQNKGPSVSSNSLSLSLRWKLLWLANNDLDGKRSIMRTGSTLTVSDSDSDTHTRRYWLARLMPSHGHDQD